MAVDHHVEYLRRALHAPDPGERAAAAKGLGRIGTRELWPELAAPLSDTHAAVRSAAAIGLGRLGEPAAENSLLTGLSDADPEVRRRCVNALNRLGATGPELIEAFRELLGDESHYVRVEVAVGLYRVVDLSDDVLRDEDVIAVMSDEYDLAWWNARRLVYNHLEAGHSRTLALAAELFPEANANFRARVLKLFPRYDPEAVLPLALIGLADRAAPVLLAAAGFFATHPVPAAQAGLHAAIEESEQAWCRSTLLAALGRLADPHDIDIFLRWLPEPVSGIGAAEALGGLATDKARCALRDVISSGRSDNEYVIAAALREIGDWADERDFPALERYVVSEKPLLKAAAFLGVTRFLARNNPRHLRLRVLDKLIAALGNVSPDDERNAFEHIPEALPRLRGLARDPGVPNRVFCVGAIGSIGEEEDSAMMTELLTDPDPIARLKAAGSLARLIDRYGPFAPALKPLLAALQDDDLAVVLTAVEALGALGDPTAIEPLERLAADRAPLAFTVERALGRIRGNDDA